MGFFSNLLSRKPNKVDEKPPITGGDGLTKHTPAIINCASMGMAHTLMERLINDHCGQDWHRDVEFTLKDPSDSNKSIKMICVITKSGNKKSFYFDLSRPVEVARKFLG